MKSRLAFADFHKRLADSVSQKNDSIFYKTPYSGTYNRETFELTTNSILIHLGFFIISGTYKEDVGNGTEVSYKINLQPFLRTFQFTVAVIALVGSNGVIFLLRNRMELPVIQTIIMVNGVLLAAMLFSIALQWWTKMIVEERFRGLFEIQG